MALVALYFWAPLVWHWFVPATGKRPVSGLVTGLILTDDPAEPASKAKGWSATKFRWEKVRQLITSDRCMVSAVFEDRWIDPFARRDVASAAEQTPQTTVQAAAPVEAGPRELGLTLTSVAIGAKRRTATINGEIYREGEVIAVGETDKATSGIEFRVVRVSASGVELERNGRTFVLELSRPSLGKGDGMVRNRE
jgi:hypothetical protein